MKNVAELGLVAALLGLGLTQASQTHVTGPKAAARAARHEQRRADYHQIRLAYAARLRAYSRKDAEAVMADTLPDWRGRRIDGSTLTRQEAESAIERRLAQVEGGTWDMDVLELSMKGGEARAHVRYGFEGTVTDSSGKIHRLSVSGTSRDTWKKTKDGWRQATSTAVTESTRMDGRPLAAIGRGGR